jgi:hypothetical protein
MMARKTTMECSEYKRAVLAEPRLLRPDQETPELRAHRESCEACREYAQRLLRFESRLERALRVEVPATVVDFGGGAGEVPADRGVPSDRVAPFRSKARSAAARRSFLGTGWRALAASALLAVVVAGALWLGSPKSSLAADVVTHMAEEPQAWRVTDVAVPGPALEAVLRDSHLRLSQAAGIVSYANSCSFRGYVVPHLVIQTGSGPVTVMVLVHENVAKSVPFDEQGYRGVIVPVPGHGSLAVLTRAPNKDSHSIGQQAIDQKAIDQIAARVEDSIVWTG